MSVSVLSALGSRTFASLLRHPNYRLYFAGNGISFIGSWMQQIAAYWLILEITRSPVAVGTLALVQNLPVLVLVLVSGAVADRFSLRRIIIICESVLAVAAATLAVVAVTGKLEAWHLYALCLLQGIAMAVGAPARHTLVFRIVGSENLPNAVALSAGLGTSARIIGPALGGLVIAHAGAWVAFLLNAATCVISISATLAMTLAPRPHQTVQPIPVLASVGEALAFTYSSRRVAITFFTVLLVSTFSFNFDVLLPLVARLTLNKNADIFGLIAAVFGGGALCGALILATIGRARMELMLLGAAGFGGFQLILAPQDSLPAVCGILFVIGIFYVLWCSSALAILQLAAPEHLRTSATSLYFFAFMGGAPLGGLLAGWLTSQGGTELAFVVAGTIALIIAASGAAVVRLAPPDFFSSCKHAAG